MFSVGTKVRLIHSFGSQDAHINRGEVIRVTKCYVWVLNQHGNKVRYHADGKCIGWSGLNNYRIMAEPKVLPLLFLIEAYTVGGHYIRFTWVRAENADDAVVKATKRIPSYDSLITCAHAINTTKLDLAEGDGRFVYGIDLNEEDLAGLEGTNVRTV